LSRLKNDESREVLLSGVLYSAVLGGGGGFALGFFGPMILDPSSGNGPMLGIFITGPIGFALGLLWGLWRNRGVRHG
jgi:hypothetical protein